MRLALVVTACVLVAACSVPIAPGPATRSWGYPDQGGGGQSGGDALGGGGDDAGDAAPDGRDAGNDGNG